LKCCFVRKGRKYFANRKKEFHQQFLCLKNTLFSTLVMFEAYFVWSWTLFAHSDQDSNNSHSGGVAQRARHPEELKRDPDKWMIDIEYYLSQQVSLATRFPFDCNCLSSHIISHLNCFCRSILLFLVCVLPFRVLAQPVWLNVWDLIHQRYTFSVDLWYLYDRIGSFADMVFVILLLESVPIKINGVKQSRYLYNAFICNWWWRWEVILQHIHFLHYLTYRKIIRVTMTDIVVVSHSICHVQAVPVPSTALLYLVWLRVPVVWIHQIQVKEKTLPLISGVVCGAQDVQIMLMVPGFLLLCLPIR
jgi:hypothetical protein